MLRGSLLLRRPEAANLSGEQLEAARVAARKRQYRREAPTFFYFPPIFPNPSHLPPTDRTNCSIAFVLAVPP